MGKTGRPCSGLAGPAGFAGDDCAMKTGACCRGRRSRADRASPRGADLQSIRTCGNRRRPRKLFSARFPLPTTEEWGEDREEGPFKSTATKAPPLPGPLLHRMEERECLVAASPRCATALGQVLTPKRYALLALVLLCAPLARAQNSVLDGKIIDNAKVVSAPLPTAEASLPPIGCPAN